MLPEKAALIERINLECHLIEHEKASVTRPIDVIYPNEAEVISVSPLELLERHGQGNLFIYRIQYSNWFDDSLEYKINYKFRNV